jgi:hypothetical protein
MEDAFETLQLPKSASLEEIDKKWRELVRMVHPDKIGAAEGTKKTQILNEAHEKAKQMYHESECTQARRLQQQSNGTSWGEELNSEKIWRSVMEDIARCEAAKTNRRAAEASRQARWKEDMAQTIISYKSEIKDLHTALEFEGARANTAEQLAEESIQMVEKETKQLQQACAEIQMKDTQLRDLLHQNKERDMFIQQANLQHAEITQQRAAMEEKLLTLQASLDEEKQRAQTAEDSAKEWEHKYNEILASEHQDKKEKKRKADEHNMPSITNDQVIKQFINEELEEDPQETSKMLTTRDLYATFLKSSEDSRQTFIHFSRQISKYIQEIFPNVRHVRTSLSKGYMGIKMKAN